MRDRSAPPEPDTRFSVRYWGVRGSHTVPGRDSLRYGGHTTCLELRCDDQTIIFDLGSGGVGLGRALISERPTGPITLEVLFSHLHSDHVIGAPFFVPLYHERTTVHIRGDDRGAVGLREGLKRLMSYPLFPVDLEELPATLEFTHLGPGETIQIGPATIRTCALNHPGGALGFRVEHRGKVFVHASDLEHEGDTPDPELVALCRGADWVSYDGMYVEGLDYESHRGWGHSTWQAAVRLCHAIGDRARVIITHHAPEHDDTLLDEIARDLAAALPGALVATEGMELSLLADEVTR